MESLIIVFLLLGPLFDVLAFYNLPVNVVVRGLYLILVIVLMLKNKKNIKTLSIILILGLISALYQIVILDFDFVETLSSTFKIMYLPISILYFKDFEFKKYSKEFILSIIIFSYIGIYLLSYVTKIGASAYLITDGKTGFKGLFTSINEFSAIIVCLLPIVSSYLNINKKRLLLVLLLISSLLCSLLIGTKILLFGWIVNIIYLIYLKREKIYINRSNLEKILMIIITILFMIMLGYLFTKTRIYKNMLVQESFFKPSGILDYINRVVFNDRLSFIGTNFDYFKSSSAMKYLFGISVLDTSVKLVEIDIFDIIFRYGIIWLIMFIYMLKYIGFKKLDFSNKLSYLLILFISLTSGHVLIYPNVCIYLALLASRKE